MPSDRFTEALNEQVGREFRAAYQYTAVAAYYDRETFPRLAKLFFDQADEERGHALKMVGYLRDTGAELTLGELPAPRVDFEDHVEPIRLALEQERQVTIKISELFEIARETRDYTSEQFIQWFLEEQVEEEAAMGDLLAVAERTVAVPMLLEEYLARDKPGARPE
jgi:bacterioferritin B